MQRTQIYFEEETIAKLKELSKELKISVSEFIRRVVKKEIEKTKQDSFLNFLEELEPIDSFKNIDSNEYIENLRKKSRLLNE
jgi:hypothetical protein